MVVTIDGPAGVGKTTISKEIAKRNNFFFVSSGELYRAISFLALDYSEVYPWEGDFLVNLAFRNGLRLDEEGRVEKKDSLLSKEDLHNRKIDEVVSYVASLSPVRVWVNEVLRNWSKGHDLVVEGRDMATTVFPEAELKVFLDASVESRTSRRLKEREGEKREEVLKALISRDEKDQKNLQDTFSSTEDSFYIDTSLLTIQEVCESISLKIREIKKY